jgi:hypothetical protein
MSRLIDWLYAVRWDGIRSAWCGHCHKRPTMADDCGFLYSEPEGTPICERCWNGAPGAAHRERYGVGDR